MIYGISGSGSSAKDLLVRALKLDLQATGAFTPLLSIIAAAAELIVERNPAGGLWIGALATRLGMRAWFRPMHAQDESRITAILDRVRETHGIPVPDVPADLTAADAIAQCLEALAALDLAI